MPFIKEAQYRRCQVVTIKNMELHVITKIKEKIYSHKLHKLKYNIQRINTNYKLLYK